MRFVICGAGAIGGVLGGQLAKAGFAVILIDKIPEHVAAINAHGLQLKGVHGTHTLAMPAVLQATAVDFRPDDVIFLAVKAFHCAAAAAALRRATTLELPIFCAQNGRGTCAAWHVHGAAIMGTRAGLTCDHSMAEREEIWPHGNYSRAHARHDKRCEDSWRPGGFRGCP
jgi:ketopantoate reductase